MEAPGPHQKMNDQPLRAPGHLERYLIHQNAVGFHNNCQVAAVYKFDPDESVKLSRRGIEELVIAALEKTLCRHPVLGTTLGDVDSARPTWKRLEHVNVRRIVQFFDADNQSNIETLLHSEHQRSLKPTKELPLWRCLVVIPHVAGSSDFPSFTMSFSYHRVIGDGYSSVYFHQTFLRAANQLLSAGGCPGGLNPTANKETRVPYLPLIPHLEESIQLPLTPYFLFSKIFQYFYGSLYSSTNTVAWSGRPIRGVEEQPPESCVRAFRLPQEEVARILNLTRQNQTTITALTTVLVARRLAWLYGPVHTQFVGSVPFSLRKFLRNHKPDSMGLFTGIAEVYFSADNSRPHGYIYCESSTTPTDKSLGEDGVLWNGARACKTLIHERRESNVNLSNGLMKFFGDFRPYLSGLVGSRRRHAFCVTNLGAVDGSLASRPQGVSKRAISFNEMYFSAGMSAISDPYTICLASVAGGYMTVTLNWDEGVVEESDALALLTGLEEDLRSVATPTAR